MDIQNQSTRKENWLIAYDIRSKSQRSKLHRRLKKRAINYQKSFFEIIANEKEMEEIASLAGEFIDEKTDKLLIICTTKSLKSYQAGINKELNPHGLFIIH